MTKRIEQLRIEPVSKSHVRDTFTCDKQPLSEYIRRHARQNDIKNIAKCFVAIDENNVVRGYYTLSTSNIEFEELPDDVAKGLPQYPVPAALIGKLAVDQSVEGEGLGSRLLIDALQRIVAVMNHMAVKVVLVDAIDQEAKGYYLRFGFIELPGHDLKLFLPVETIVELFEK